jgi:hypothetical protein
MDPSLATSYPSAILCREKALVVSLEHIKVRLPRSINRRRFRCRDDCRRSAEELRRFSWAVAFTLLTSHPLQ